MHSSTVLSYGPSDWLYLSLRFKMYNNHRCVAVDPYQLACEHCKQPEHALHLGESAEFPFYKLEHGKYSISDGEEEHFEAISVPNMEFKKRIADIPIENASSVHESSLNFSQDLKISQGTEALENGKRPLSSFCDELVSKRVKIEDEAGKLRQFEENFSTTIASEEKPFLEKDGKRATCDAIKVDIRQCQLAGASFFPGYEYLHRAGFDHLHLEDVLSPHWEYSHRRLVPIGPDHQADLPQWSPQDFKSSGSTHSPPVIVTLEDSADKWLGTRVNAMPTLLSMPMEARLCRSKEDCDCADEGSVRCVRQHVIEAREKLERELGKKMFTELGFPDMGEDVGRRWTEEEENLFHMIVLSNSASSGRNFWTVLPRNFPSRSFREIVSYYFNVLVLRMRADQNRMDPLNADSDNDEWQGCSDGESETSEEDEGEEDSVVESPADGNVDASSEELDIDDEADDEEEHEKHLVGAEDGGFYCSSGGSAGGYTPMPPCEQPIDQYSRDCSLDRDVQDESCSSFEGLSNVSDSCVDRDREMVGFGDYNDYMDVPHDSKSWEISYSGAAEKDFDFFPTCNVIEEVFGKGI